MRDNKKNKLDELICEVLGQMQERKYGSKILSHYRSNFVLLTSVSNDIAEEDISERLIEVFLVSPVSCNKKWAGKERIHCKRCIKLLSSLAQTGAIDWGKQKSKDIYRMLTSEIFRLELETFYDYLKEVRLCPNTILGYKRMVTYFLLFCQDNGYRCLLDLKPDYVRRFIESLYRDSRYRPNTIGSALSGLHMFLSRNNYTEPFALEIPVHLPRARNTIEVYNDKELATIEPLLLSGHLTKKDIAICRLLMETGLRGTDVFSLKLRNIDWDKDSISIIQGKTIKHVIQILARSSPYVAFIISQRPIHNRFESVNTA